MRIAVSAASGRLGRAVLDHLTQRGADVVAIVRDPARFPAEVTKVRTGDYTDRDGFRHALHGVDTLLLISAPVRPGTDRISMHRSAIGAAAEAGVRRVLYTSVIGNGRERDTAFWPAQQVNRQAEADLAASGLAWTVGRNGLYLDLDVGHIRHAAEGDGVYRNNAGEGRCGYLSIDRLGAAYAALLTGPAHDGRILTLAGEPVTQEQIVAAVSEVFGVRVRYEPITAAQNVQRFLADPMIAARGEEVARMLTGCFAAIAAGAFDVPSDLEAVTGARPPTLHAQLTELRERAGPR